MLNTNVFSTRVSCHFHAGSENVADKMFILTDRLHYSVILGNGGEIQWCFSQVKGTLEEDISEG